MNCAIEASDLTRAYKNGLKAVDGISLSVGRGEIFSLLGVNGAGKTTFIKIISTLLRPSSGRVFVLGRDVTEQPVEVKKRIGVVPQENNLDTRLTVRQNLVFHCRYFGLGKKEYSAEIDEWMELLGLKDKEGEMVFRLSGGTRRKVMLAKAFVTRPELLILDEPTSGLDPEVRAAVWGRIREFPKKAGTVFLSTHHLEEAEKLSDRIAIIRSGRLAAIGKPSELKQRAAENNLCAEAGMEELFRLTVGGLI